MGAIDGVRFELKYCQRCGMLGLRDGESGGAYCEGCERRMAGVYLAPSEQRPGAMRSGADADGVRA